MLKARGTPLVLGLRDVMDEPGQLAEEWERKNAAPALIDLYDAIWVYGLPQICNALEGIVAAAVARGEGALYRLSAPRAGSHGTARRPAASPIGAEPYLLVTTGGGGDGAHADRLGVARLRVRPRPPLPALLVLGPFMQSSLQAEFMAPGRAAASAFTPSLSKPMSRT